MISTARAALWTNRPAVPVTFKLGRKYLKCSDSVFTIPGQHQVVKVTPTFLQIATVGLSDWANGNIEEVLPDVEKKGFGVMTYKDCGDCTKLSGPWNTFDNNLHGTGSPVQKGDTVRVRVAPVVHNIAPGEFSLGLRAVDVMVVGSSEAH